MNWKDAVSVLIGMRDLKQKDHVLEGVLVLLHADALVLHVAAVLLLATAVVLQGEGPTQEVLPQGAQDPALLLLSAEATIDVLQARAVLVLRGNRAFLLIQNYYLPLKTIILNQVMKQYVLC